jgi:hypothetical protein
MISLGFTFPSEFENALNFKAISNEKFIVKFKKFKAKLLVNNKQICIITMVLSLTFFVFSDTGSSYKSTSKTSLSYKEANVLKIITSIGMRILLLNFMRK